MTQDLCDFGLVWEIMPSFTLNVDVMPNSNRSIDHLILSFGSAHMDFDFGMAMLSAYLHDLDLLAAGVPYTELGISKRRASTMPTVLSQEGGEIQELPWSELRSGGNVVSFLRLAGVMRAEDEASSRGVSSFADDLRMADQAPNVLGHVVEINSGGGQSTAGSMAMNALGDAKKPVIVVGHTVGSAAYMAALGADRIYAATEESQFGSIGSFLSLDRGFAQWYKSRFEDIYADVSTQKNSEFRAYLDGDIAPLQKMVNKSAQDFRGLVTSHRSLKGGQAKINDTLEGAMFDARQSKIRGLIDGYATVNEAAEEVIILSKAGANRRWKSKKRSNMSELKQALSVINRVLGGDTTEGQDPETGANGTAQKSEQFSPDQILERMNELSEQVDSLSQSAADEGDGSISDRVDALADAVQNLTQGIEQVSDRLAALEQKHTTLASELAGDIGKKLKLERGEDGSASKTETAFEEQIGRNTRGAIRVVGS